MKKLSFLKAMALGLAMFTGSGAMAASVNAVAGGHCGEHTSCNCWRYYGDCAWAVHAGGYTGSPSEMPIKISVVNETTIQVEYLRPLNELDDAKLDLANDVDLPASVSRALGYTSIIILAGTYQVNNNTQHGNILFKVKSRTQ